MFTTAQRDQVRDALLARARSDPAITAAAITGSLAAGQGDGWSDVDIALAVAGPLDAAMRRWTDLLHGEFGAVHHWDLHAVPAVYRVFLLPGWLEADIAFVPEDSFGPRGPHWRTVFGTARPAGPPAGQEPGALAGRAWHHALHARASIARGRSWQAEYWISALRDLVLALACVRLGYPDSYGKGAHLLPAELTGPLRGALVTSLEPAELARALSAAVVALAAELKRTDDALAARLNPMLAELAAPDVRDAS